MNPDYSDQTGSVSGSARRQVRLSKRMGIVILAVMVLTLISIADALAMGLLTLPTDPITATFRETFQDVGGDSFFDVTLSDVGAGFDLQDNMTYDAWCIDPYSGPPPYDGGSADVTAYSSYDSNLPLNVKFYQGDPIPWDKINYVLNNKSGNGNNVINPAIWYFITGQRRAWITGWECAVGSTCDGLVQAANLNGVGFVPQPGQVEAVILRQNGIGGLGVDGSVIFDDGFQDVIIEVPVPQPKATVGDRVWYDDDGDGVQDGGEAGIADVTVTLQDPGPDNNCGTPDDVILKSDVTDVNGLYLFKDLAAGDYCVVIDETTLPDNVTQTFEKDESLDGNTRQPLAPGDNIRDVDFGYQPLRYTLGDRVWYDQNQNGLQDGERAGLQRGCGGPVRQCHLLRDAVGLDDDDGGTGRFRRRVLSVHEPAGGRLLPAVRQPTGGLEHQPGQPGWERRAGLRRQPGGADSQHQPDGG